MTTEINKEPPLVNAAIKNHIEVIRQLLNNGLNQAEKDEAFELAIAYGNLEIADLLLSNGANIHKPDDKLYYACHNSEYESVKYLIEKGIDINSEDGIVAFMLSQTGTLEIIQWIKNRGADLHIKDDQPLINSIIYDKTDIAKYLLEQGANPNAQNGQAIREAGIRGNLEILKILIDKGAQVKGYSEEAKMMNAIWLINDNHISIIKFLFTIRINEADRNDFILNWVINYPNRKTKIFDTNSFSRTEELLKQNGIDLNSLLPKQKWFRLFNRK